MRRMLLAAALLAASIARAEPPLRAVATTTLAGDVVAFVAGTNAEVRTLLPPESDPHAFQPVPRDAALVARADILFMSGLGLESFLEPLLRQAGAKARLVDLSAGLPVRMLEEPCGEEHDHAAHDHGPGHGEADPHVWLDPLRVAGWATNAAAALAAARPGPAESFRARAAEYGARMAGLDRWAQGRFAGVPPARRKLVADHATFGYLAERYGLTVAGSVAPGFSSAAEPSARDLARLYDLIRRERVPAVFVGRAVNPALAARVARDTGARLVTLNTCALGPAGAPDGTYEGFFRTLVDAIVGGLGEVP